MSERTQRETLGQLSGGSYLIGSALVIGGLTQIAIIANAGVAGGILIVIAGVALLLRAERSASP